MASTAVARLKYFDLSGFGGLAGRGGSVRFFLLANGIRFEEETVDWNDWASKLKADAIKSGDSPTGHLPQLHIDGHDLFETLAILRYLAKRVDCHSWSPSYGADVVRDFKVDSLADVAAECRVALLKAAFGSSEDKQAYLSSPDQRTHIWHTLNTLMERYGSTGSCAVGSSSSFADAVVYALLWDDTAVFGVDKKLWEEAPKVVEFFRAYLAQEPVMVWCKANRPDLCEQLRDEL